MIERKPLIRKLESDDELRSAIPVVMEATAEFLTLGRQGRKSVTEEEVASYLLSLNGSSSDFWVAEINGGIVGYTEGHVGGINGEKYVSNYVYVSSGNRRRGIGKTLKEVQLQRARELGCTYISTSIDRENDAGLALQKSFGAQLTTLIANVSSVIHL